MALEFPTQVYNGRIKEVTLGQGPRAVTVGGESCYPFYLFEGKMPHPPRIAMEVYDTPPESWPEAALAPFRDVATDPVAWARKCVSEYHADMVCLQLESTDPNGLNRGADEAAELSLRVARATDVPLIILGTANVEKDSEVLRKVSEVCQGQRLAIGPVAESNYKKIGAAAIGYGHTVIASSPIDINMAKQLNILLGNLGVPDDRLIIDPTVSSIGYGIEYTYSVMERIRIAALTQQDDKLQSPIIANIATETWATKEARADQDDLGDAARRGIMMEAMSAQLLLLAGADILVMRHPEAVRLIRETIARMT